MHVSLKRVDTEHNMDRWYTIAVQPTLLDSVAVVCAWGSRRSRYHRLRILPTSSSEEAFDLAKGHRSPKNAPRVFCQPGK